jgi:hypothetical protein
VARRTNRQRNEQQYGLQAELHISPFGTTGRWTATAEVRPDESPALLARDGPPLERRTECASSQAITASISSARHLARDKKNHYNRPGLPCGGWPKRAAS